MQSTTNNHRHLQTRCPFCQTSIRANEPLVVCSCCKMPHHRECWSENGQCTTYGCKGISLPGGAESFRRNHLPVIDITFDDSQKPGFWQHHSSKVWKAAALVAFLLGGGYYLMTLL